MTRRVVIVGAGLAGLVAGRELQAEGADVTLLDKGRSVGGRLATRRIGGATLDHGAQFFTVRTPAFRARVDDWIERGLVHVWNRGFTEHDGHERYVATNGMNSLAKDLALGLTTHCATMVFSINPADTGADHRWVVKIDDGTMRPADAVILTCPLPQSFALLVDSGVELVEGLFFNEYDRTIGLLARLDGSPAIPAPGGVQDADEVFSFVADNAAKGVSAEPAVTFHANPQWSEEHWDLDEAALLERLHEAAAPWLGGASILESQLKKWRLATPRSVWPDPCWSAAEATVVLAGDAFAGPRMEGAHNSGLAAAHTLLH